MHIFRFRGGHGKKYHLLNSTASPWMVSFRAGTLVVGRAGNLYEDLEEDSRTKAAAVHHAPGAIYPDIIGQVCCFCPTPVTLSLLKFVSYAKSK